MHRPIAFTTANTGNDRTVATQESCTLVDTESIKYEPQQTQATSTADTGNCKRRHRLNKF